MSMFLDTTPYSTSKIILVRWATIVSPTGCGSLSTFINHYSNPSVGYNNGNTTLPTGTASKNNAQLIRDKRVRTP